MARGLNRVMLIGFVERGPEIRRAANGKPVASFTISANRQWITNAGQNRNSTDWFNIVAWGDLAEAVEAEVHNDQRLYVEGHLQTRGWDDADGQRHVRTEVVAGRVIPMDTRQTIAARATEPGNDNDAALCLNRVMVIGNLGRNPEMRYTPDGQAVTSFSLAATRTWSHAQGQRSDSTEWFNVIAWGSLAEICNQHLARGRRVYVEGELRTRGWEQADGSKHSRTELLAGEMIMLGPRPKNRPAEREPDELGDEPPF